MFVVFTSMDLLALWTSQTETLHIETIHLTKYYTCYNEITTVDCKYFVLKNISCAKILSYLSFVGGAGHKN